MINLEKPVGLRVRFIYFLPIMTVILIVAFGLRIVNITITDLDLDESWTYMNYVYMQYPDGFSQAFREPNNALHILMTSTMLNFVPWRLGARLLSIMAGLLCVAITTRIGIRLFNPYSAIWIALVSATAYNSIIISQTARPYIFANLLGLMALLMWLERRQRWNTLFSSLVPFFHIGAMPLVMIQDVYTLLEKMSGKHVNTLHWILSRLPPYLMLLTILLLAYLRRVSGKVISAGQSPPTLLTLLEDIIRNIHTPINFNMLEAHNIVFLLCMVIVLGFVIWQVNHTKSLIIIAIWISLSYGVLIFMAVVSDGPIKFIHITHLAYAFALLFGFGISRMPKSLMYFVLLLLVGTNLIFLNRFYKMPFQSYSQTYIALQEWYQGKDSIIYFQSIDPMNALALNAKSDLENILQKLPSDLPEHYYNIRFRGFDSPSLLPQCDSTPSWVYWDFHIYECGMGKP